MIFKDVYNDFHTWSDPIAAFDDGGYVSENVPYQSSAMTTESER